MSHSDITRMFSLFASVSIYTSMDNSSWTAAKTITYIYLPVSRRSVQYSARSSLSSASLFLRCSLIYRAIWVFNSWESVSLPWLPLGLPHPELPQSAYHSLFSRRPSHRIRAASVQLSAGLPVSYPQHVFVPFPACLAHSQAGHRHAVK